MDEKLEMLLPTPTDYGYAKVDESRVILSLLQDANVTANKPNIAKSGSR